MKLLTMMLDVSTPLTFAAYHAANVKKFTLKHFLSNNLKKISNYYMYWVSQEVAH